MRKPWLQTCRDVAGCCRRCLRHTMCRGARSPRCWLIGGRRQLLRQNRGKAPKDVDYIGARPKVASSMEAPRFEAGCQRLSMQTLSGLSNCSLQHQAHPCTPTSISQAALQPVNPQCPAHQRWVVREQQPRGCNTTGSAEDGLTLPVWVQCRRTFMFDRGSGRAGLDERAQRLLFFLPSPEARRSVRVPLVALGAGGAA